MVRVVVLMSAVSVMAAVMGLGLELGTAEHELQVTVEEGTELMLSTPVVSLTASPFEELSFVLDDELTYNTNAGHFDNGVKVTVVAEGEPEDWFSMSVEASEIFDPLGGDPVGEVALTDQGEHEEEADLITSITGSGSFSTDLTYLVARAPWRIEAGTEFSVSVVYRLIEE